MDKTSPEKLDNQLLQLALLAQKHPAGSAERRLALTKLVEAINRQAHRLIRPTSNKSEYVGLQLDIFYLGLQKLLFFIYHPDTNIDSYKPELGSVMVWINIKLDRRFFQEAYKELKGVKIVKGKPMKIPSIYDLNRKDLDFDKDFDFDDIPTPPENPSLSERIKKCIEEDPEGIFQVEILGKNCEANFQAIALRRLAGVSWQTISEEFGINAPSTASSFYYRCLKKFAAKIKAYLQEQE